MLSLRLKGIRETQLDPSHRCPARDRRPETQTAARESSDTHNKIFLSQRVLQPRVRVPRERGGSILPTWLALALGNLSPTVETLTQLLLTAYSLYCV